MHASSKIGGLTAGLLGTVSQNVVTVVKAASQHQLDVAYCYRQSSVVCLSVTVVSSAKMAEPIEMPFGLWTQVTQRKHVLDGWSAH